MQDGMGGQKGWRFHTRSSGEEEPGAFYTWRNTGALNQIKKIENIDVLKNLRFLSLSWNRVEKIQNLRCLTNLQFLDISHNLIKRLDAGELPRSLLILDLTGNPCTKAKDYRHQILEALPLLQQLDGETVRDSENSNSLRIEGEEDGSSSDDSDESLPFVLEGLSSVSQEMMQRSYQRRDRALREHEERLSELSDTPNKQLLITAQNATANIVSQECSSMSLKQASTCTTKPQNAMISEKKHQNSALVKKQLKDQQNNGTAMPPSKLIARNQESVSSRKPGNGRLSEGLNRTSCKKLLPSAPQSKPDTVPSVKTPSALNTPQKERQTISAPSTRKMNVVPTKNTLPGTREGLK
ncbi:leucine-rich repeat-containing protein 46 isoform X2 [Bufo gargarizans]|uniref:leucine-rich repeat-containing protein 46 isoform X2 n=1 Tax=Bufo gargarizans TaxID=30331 RepID=UPI001CF26526|nr:leucine-rich repeat-containing protein 46 isoform X2 [Bufo gargarizans]